MKVKVCSAILFRICMLCAETRLRYQVSVNMTIGPLFQNMLQPVTRNLVDAYN